MGIFSWFVKKHFLPLREKLKESKPLLVPLSEDDKELIKIIHTKTNLLNRNNITRTMAYLELYIRFPEMQWALLAHLVSRNAGWNMTDLKGEWISRIFTEKSCFDYFLFMERSNWLIFQDAFPQLLLYSYGKERQKNLFYLLPYLNISRFMQVIWDKYWLEGNKELLCTALIINEQSYIEKRIIEKKQYGAPVISDIKFFMQEILNLNMILFPSLLNGSIQLYGEQVDSFPKLYKRIELGKRLYKILYTEEVFDGVLQWCKQTVHSGSRADYLPEIFSPKAHNLSTEYRPHLDKLRLLPGMMPLYSPYLTDVWQDYRHEPASIGDWFEDVDIVEQLQLEDHNATPIEKSYGDLLSKLEKIILGKQLISS